MRYLLHDVFTAAAERSPGAIAIACESGQSWTYSDLDALSNRFAAYISTRQPRIRDNPYVGILSPVNALSIAALLGALKCGAAYVPLDEQSPPDRLAKIIANTGLQTLFVNPAQLESFRGLLQPECVRNVCVLGDSLPGLAGLAEIERESAAQRPLLNQVSDDLAYILHTSGSTGVPKGIMLTHRNARTFADWMHKEFAIRPSDTVMSRAPFKFDLSVFDIFNTFLAGAKLVCFDWDRPRPKESKHADYVSLMQRERASVLYTTPSTLITLMNKGGLGAEPSNLRLIMYAGEPFPTPLLRKLMERLPGTRVANIYGPTETNIITCQWCDELPADDSPVPLGLEVDDTEILVVSEDGKRVCDPDEVGELWCRGGTVTLGYLNMPEKTRECLVESPFHRFPARFWRTGDFARRDARGILHYHGRRDHMIKVRGFRVELGEIEAALAKCEAIGEFAVVAVPDPKIGSRLVCYYSALAGMELEPDGLRGFLAAQLPEYMLPYSFLRLASLPHTSSGKIDRVLLAEEAARTLENGSRVSQTDGVRA